MSKTNIAASRRLERLERVLAGRQARLAATMTRPPRRAAPAGPLDGLQRYGYAAALVLATTAILPTLLAFAWRGRKVITAVALNGWGVRKFRKRFDAVRSEGGR